MKKRGKRFLKTAFPRKKKEKYNKKLIILIDGFNGILALMIYNFLLFVSKVFGIGGFIGKIENTMGYFTLNFFRSLNITKSSMIFGVLVMFIFSFLLGVGIARIIRKVKKVEF